MASAQARDTAERSGTVGWPGLAQAVSDKRVNGFVTMPGATHYSATVIDRPIDVAFSYVSDFANAPTWDPQALSTRRLSDGAIGVGSRIEMKARVGSRLSFVMPYEIVEIAAPQRVVYEGQTALFRYRDELDFTEDGPATLLSYNAHLSLRGPLRLLHPLVRKIWQRVGDTAVRNMAQAVLDNTAGAASG